jgi:hypothetical protein
MTGWRRRLRRCSVSIRSAGGVRVPRDTGGSAQASGVGPAPLIVLFRYAPGRGGIYAERFLAGFRGRLLQCDGYGGYERRIGDRRGAYGHGPGDQPVRRRQSR